MIDLTDINLDHTNIWTVDLYDTSDGKPRSFTIHNGVGIAKAFAKLIIERGNGRSRADQALAAKQVSEFFKSIDERGEADLRFGDYYLDLYPTRVITNFRKGQ